MLYAQCVYCMCNIQQCIMENKVNNPCQIDSWGIDQEINYTWPNTVHSENDVLQFQEWNQNISVGKKHLNI